MLAQSIPTHILDAVTPRHLRLIIFPTEKCNFRCAYCYENFEKGRIDKRVVTGIKNLITIRAPDLNVLELAWFGGEPLLAVEDIVSLCTHAKETASNYDRLQFISSITTNGFLLNTQTARRLASVGVRSYQISLDGSRDNHDVSRPTTKGKGTFDTIWRNLTQLAESDINFEINIRVHYRKETWQDLFPLIDDLNRLVSDDARFKVFFKSIVRLGGANDSNITVISRAENKDVMDKLYARLSGGYNKASYWVKKDYVCYASKINSFVIRADGAINKCTVALQDERNVVGRINEDGSFLLNRDKILPWIKGLESMDSYELSCPYNSHIKS